MRIIITEKKIKYGLFIVPAGLLFGALAEGAPYEYFQVLRVVVSVAALILAAEALDSEDKYFPFLFGCIVLLFNPILPFHFRKGFWQVLDVLSGGIFLLYGFSKIKKGKKDKISPEMRKIFDALYPLCDALIKDAFSFVRDEGKKDAFIELISLFSYNENQKVILTYHFLAFQFFTIPLMFPKIRMNSFALIAVKILFNKKMQEDPYLRERALLKNRMLLIQKRFDKFQSITSLDGFKEALSFSFWDSVLEDHPQALSKVDAINFAIDDFLVRYYMDSIDFLAKKYRKYFRDTSWWDSDYPSTPPSGRMINSLEYARAPQNNRYDEVFIPLIECFLDNKIEMLVLEDFRAKNPLALTRVVYRALCDFKAFISIWVIQDLFNNPICNTNEILDAFVKKIYAHLEVTEINHLRAYLEACEDEFSACVQLKQNRTEILLISTFWRVMKKRRLDIFDQLDTHNFEINHYLVIAYPIIFNLTLVLYKRVFGYSNGKHQQSEILFGDNMLSQIDYYVE